jgi:hypothetical protein
MADRLHRWTHEELAELFYNALLRDARSEGFTVEQMRKMANNAARGVSWPMPVPGVSDDA